MAMSHHALLKPYGLFILQNESPSDFQVKSGFLCIFQQCAAESYASKDRKDWHTLIDLRNNYLGHIAQVYKLVLLEVTRVKYTPSEVLVGWSNSFRNLLRLHLSDIGSVSNHFFTFLKRTMQYSHPFHILIVLLCGGFQLLTVALFSFVTQLFPSLFM